MEPSTPPAADSEPPLLSVLIPAYNEARLLPSVLERVRTSFAAIGFASYEIVVCDNNSSDGTADAARSGGARVVHEPHNQISRARNTAAKGARGKWFIFLDGDTLLSPELLRATVRCFEDGKICAGGAGLRFDLAKVGPFAAAMTWLWNRISAWAGLAAGSYLFCYRQAWEDCGGFDEGIYAGEEIFFSQKLKRWAKTRRLRFRILAGTPVVTSARKVEWYGQWGLLWHVLRMMRPGALRSRESCSLWYSRPPVRVE